MQTHLLRTAVLYKVRATSSDCVKSERNTTSESLALLQAQVLDFAKHVFNAAQQVSDKHAHLTSLHCLRRVVGV